MEEEEGVVSALWDRLAENVSAALSKVTTKCWALHGHASAASGAGAGGLEDGLPPRHVPLIWLMHDTSFPTVLSIRFNDTETSRTQLTKAQLTHQVNNDQVVQFKVLGLQVMLLVHCEVEASWLSTTYKYTYKCTVDGKDLKENLESVAAGRTAAGAAREEGVLVPNELSQHVTVPEFREVPAKRDPSTGLASTNELLAEFKVSLRLNGGKTVEQWHRFSHFANMHAALRSCVRDTPAEAELPPLPPKSWGLNGHSAGQVFLTERTKALDTYMKAVTATPSVCAAHNPYILGMFGMLQPSAQAQHPGGTGVGDAAAVAEVMARVGEDASPRPASPRLLTAQAAAEPEPEPEPKPEPEAEPEAEPEPESTPAPALAAGLGAPPASPAPKPAGAAGASSASQAAAPPAETLDELPEPSFEEMAESENVTEVATEDNWL